MTPEETDSDLPVSVQESPAVRRQWPGAGLGALIMHGPSEGGPSSSLPSP